MLGLRNDASFLSLPAKLGTLIIICAIIGLLRNAFSVGFDSFRTFYNSDPAILWLLGIRPKFYSFDPDILWTMFNFPIQLFLFPSALLYWQLRLMGYHNVDAETIFGLSFNLQVLHLIIPFLDWIGFAMGMPWAYTIGTHKVATEWYINYLVMSPGIIVAWSLTGYMVAKVLRQRFKIPWSAVLFTSLTTFLVILMPTYFFFPTFNTLFARAFGVLTWDPQDPRLNYPILVHWGYGTYFAVTALFGFVYLCYVRRRNERMADA
jgi:hypothetical protein